MAIADLLKMLPVRSKKDPIPGVTEILEEFCPVCSARMFLREPCCSNPNHMKECSCGYKIVATEYNDRGISLVVDESGAITTTEGMASS